MFSTDLSTILFSFVAIVVLAIAAQAFFAARRTENRVKALVANWEEALAAVESREEWPYKRVAEIEAALTELTDAYDALLKSHKKLRSRIGMREHRAKKKRDGDTVDAFTGHTDNEMASMTDKTALRLAAKSKNLIP